MDDIDRETLAKLEKRTRILCRALGAHLTRHPMPYNAAEIGRLTDARDYVDCALSELEELAKMV